MLAANAKQLKNGDVVFNNHYKRKETVVKIILRPAEETNKRITYPLIETKESREALSCRLFRLVKKE